MICFGYIGQGHFDSFCENGSQFVQKLSWKKYLYVYKNLEKGLTDNQKWFSDY